MGEHSGVCRRPFGSVTAAERFAAYLKGEAARKKYGEGMRGVGGMDKTCLRLDRDAVDRELERMRCLASLGGFLPCPDHRLMPGTKFELVQYYDEEIKKIKL